MNIWRTHSQCTQQESHDDEEPGGEDPYGGQERGTAQKWLPRKQLTSEPAIIPGSQHGQNPAVKLTPPETKAR